VRGWRRCWPPPGWYLPNDVAAQAQEPVVSVGTATVVEAFARVDWVQALVPVTLDHPAPARCHRRVRHR
jgi:hypothetical protein